MLTKVCDTPMDVARELADLLVAWHRKGELGNIALSGGSTPKLLFDLLASEYRDALPWQELSFYWGDERCVPPDHEESNYGMTRERLLVPLEIPAQQVYRIRGEEDPGLEAERYAGLLAQSLPTS